MKKIVFISLLFILIGSLNSFSQEIDGNSLSNVYQDEGVSASELHSKLNFVISNIYNSANDVIQMNDPESKKIVIRARADIPLPNHLVFFYPNNKLLSAPELYEHDYTLNIECRDGRYRMEIKYNQGRKFVNASAYYSGGYQDYIYTTNMTPSDEYIKSLRPIWSNILESGTYMLIGKKRKMAFLDGIPNQVNEYAEILKKYSLSLFERIDKEVKNTSTKKDDW